jgi:glutathione S-transferase
MRLYFSPLSCSLAATIVAAEAGLALEREQVNLRTKTLKRDGSDYRRVAPAGQVPALVTAEGALLFETPSILLYLADRAPETGLAPPAHSLARYQLLEALSFIGSEVHKHGFYPLFAPDAPPAAKAYASETVLPRKLRLLEERLRGRDFLLQMGFTAADAYLVAVLNWTRFAPVSLDPFPELSRYLTLQLARPKVASCIEADTALFAARHA